MEMSYGSVGKLDINIHLAVLIIVDDPCAGDRYT